MEMKQTFLWPQKGAYGATAENSFGVGYVSDSRFRHATALPIGHFQIEEFCAFCAFLRP
jgi:hypothetical protein